MKKPKLNLDAAKIKSFLLNHCEKMILVVVVLLVAMFVYRGYQLPGLEADKTPPSLLQASAQTTEHIDNAERWNEVKDERQVAMQVEELVVKSQAPTSADAYFLPYAWSRPNFPKLSPRTDPTIFAPLHVVVRPIYGPMAYFPTARDVDPLEPIPVEEEATIPKLKPPVRRPPRPQRGEGADLIGGGEMPGGEEGGRRTRGRSRTRPGAEGYAEASPQEMPGMTDGGYGTGLAQGINPESIRGFMPGGEGAAIARPVKANVVLAVVHYAKQIEEFQNALSSSLDYDPQRDHPFFLQFWVERAEVTDPAADPATLTWTNLKVNAALAESQNWAGTLPDIVDPAYLDERLTHPAPPFMQRDIWDLLTHPDVPLATFLQPIVDETGVPGTGPGATGAANDDLPSAPLPPGVGGQPGGYGEGSALPGARPFGFGGRMAGGEGGARASAMPGGYGEGGGQPGYGADGSLAPPPKYKLIRFTDMTVEHGRKYRYRVKVLLHDPNHPIISDPARQITGYTAPNVVSLANEVRDRIKKVDVEDAKRGNGFRTYWVTSEWSEPSDEVTLPPTRQFFAGSVTPATSVEINKAKIPTGQAKGKALAIVWDEVKVVDVPGEQEVYRGSILNFVKDAQVIHPVAQRIVDLKQYPFRTDAIVADMMGGDTIPPVDRANQTPLQAPGELLIVDAQGNVHVQTESFDVEGFRTYLVPPPPPMQNPNAFPGGEGGEGQLPGYESLLDGPVRGRPRNRGT